MTQNVHVNSKLPNVGTTIFTTVGKLANDYKAINLSQGFPDFEASPELLGLVNKAMELGHNQYAPMQGILSLRETLSHKIEQTYGHYYHPEKEITVTAGATQSIFTAIGAFVNKGDEVIIITPAYDCYEPAIELFGGISIAVQLKGNAFRLDIDELKNAITPKTRMLIINTPHNPSGSVLDENDMLAIETVLQDTDIILLSDEVYEHIIFDGQEHQSAARYKGLAERAIICSSFGKTFHVTGWKIGYCVAPEALMKEFQKVHQFNVFCVNHPVQRALGQYLKKPERYLQLAEFYQAKRDYFLEAISASRFKFTPSQGTYFQLADYSAITNEPDIAFVERLIKEHGIATIPVSVFNKDAMDNRQIRFCFAKTQETLDKAAEIIHAI